MQPWVALERLYSGLTKSYLLLSLVGRDHRPMHDALHRDEFRQ